MSPITDPRCEECGVPGFFRNDLCPDCETVLLGCRDEDDEAYCYDCHNTGCVDCQCGGDLCVCMNQGEQPCPHCDRGQP